MSADACLNDHDKRLIEDGFASPYTSADDGYSSDEAPELKLDLQKLQDIASDVASARCFRIRKLTRGTNHEVFLLEFEPGIESKMETTNSCIARVARHAESLEKATSELATMRYVKDHTSLPIARIFYTDLDPTNPVGAPFVLMERLPGKHLYTMWDDLSLDQKKGVLRQIAGVLAQLATVHFDGIGSLQDNGLGPLVHPCLPQQEEKPFQSTLDYLTAFLSKDLVECPKTQDLYQQVRQELEKYFSSKPIASYLNPPFRLIHGHFDAQNLLFIKSPDARDKVPILSGVIDFKHSYSGPLYYLYEYPIFIQDCDISPELYEENAILRPHFARALRQSFPAGSPDSIAARDVMREKNFFLNQVHHLIHIMEHMSRDDAASWMHYFLRDLRDGTGLAYDGRRDYVPDRELDSDED